MNKKGAEMTIGTIVIIVLALIVLVVIALGFTTGWRNLWDKVNVFSGGNTIATVAQACNIACEAGDVNGWCFAKRTWKGDDGKPQPVSETASCRSLADKQTIAGCTNPDIDAVVKDTTTTPPRCPAKPNA